MKQRLRGRTIAVTRSADAARELCDMLESEGAKVVLAPVISIGPPADEGVELVRSVAALDEGDAVIVTSANGASALLAAGPDGPSVDVTVAAVGPATADALSGTPWQVDVIPKTHTAKGLAGELGAPSGSGHALYVSAHRAGAELTQLLSGAGWSVTQVDAYRTVLVKPTVAEMSAAGAADAITFTSGSTVEGWMAAGPSRTPLIASLGPSASKVVSSKGLSVAAQAQEQTVVGLVEAVVLCLGRPQ